MGNPWPMWSRPQRSQTGGRGICFCACKSNTSWAPSSASIEQGSGTCGSMEANASASHLPQEKWGWLRCYHHPVVHQGDVYRYLGGVTRAAAWRRGTKALSDAPPEALS